MSSYFIRLEIGKTINPLCFKTMLHQGLIKKIIPEFLELGFQINAHATSTRYYFNDSYLDVYLTSVDSIQNPQTKYNHLHTIVHQTYEKLISRKFYQYQYDKKYIQKKGLILPLDFKVIGLEKIKHEYIQENTFTSHRSPECTQFEEVLFLKYKHIEIQIRQIVHKNMEENNSIFIEFPVSGPTVSFEETTEFQVIHKMMIHMVKSHYAFISRKNQVMYDLNWLQKLKTWDDFMKRYKYKSIPIPTSFFYLMDNTPILDRLETEDGRRGIHQKISQYMVGKRSIKENELGKEADVDHQMENIRVQTW